MDNQREQPPRRRNRRSPTPAERRERKHRVLTQGTPAVVRSIADALVIKDANLFFLCESHGRVRLHGNHGFGLYYNDCRYLNGYELTISDSSPVPLVATAARGFMCVLQLTNDTFMAGNDITVREQQLGMEWQRSIDSSQPALHDVLTFENFGFESVEFKLKLSFAAGFEDLYAVRELVTEERMGRLHAPEWHKNVLHFQYDGADGVVRTTSIRISPAPALRRQATASLQVRLEARQKKQVFVSIFIGEGNSSLERAQADVDGPAIQVLLARTTDEWLNHFTQIQSDSISLDRIMQRSLLDMRVLRSNVGGRDFYSAGVPWFATLFGRDSAVAALQMLAWNPEVAAHTLRLLAAYQADRVDEWRDAQPGKVLHELRVGELARMGEIPHTPYYGTVDATPLFLILLARHAAWTADLKLFDELRPNVEAALRWMDEFGDSDGDEYIEYKSSSEKGLVNQGWKDSGDAIINDDGTLARPPISMVEVQAYKYMAKMGIAELYERSGDSGRARQLREQAAKLRDCFNRDFWLDDLHCYALALQDEKQPCRVVTSNPGHALWAGIADPDKARQVATRLMADDMYSGWGIRTLASGDKRYNPIGYHLGTVWPHDNAIIGAGFRRYGFDDDFRRVFTGIVDAVTYFPGYRLPELFAGFARADFGVPVPYPVACHPQAWSAGTIPWLVETLLGLQPEAFENRLRIVRPLLPEFLFVVDLRGLRVGRGRVDLRFERTREGGVQTTVTANEGELDVQIEP